MHRRGRALVTGLVVGALVSPVVLDADSFPLSTYPMYSRVRGDEVTFVTAYGLDEEERSHRLSLGAIGDSDDPLIVAGELRAAISAGRAQERCDEIARRAPASVDGHDLVALEIVDERHDVLALAAGEPSLVDRRQHAVCDVPGGT